MSIQLCPTEVTTRVIAESENKGFPFVCKAWSLIKGPILTRWWESAFQGQGLSQNIIKIIKEKGLYLITDGVKNHHIKSLTQVMWRKVGLTYGIRVPFLVTPTDFYQLQDQISETEEFKSVWQNRLRTTLATAGIKNLPSEDAPVKTIRKFLRNLDSQSINRIREIDLSGLSLNYFPEEILIFKNLQVLDLKNNNLRSIENLHRLRDLQTLDLANNEIESLPKLPKSLTALYLKNNDLKTINIDIPSLEYIDFDDNPLENEPIIADCRAKELLKNSSDEDLVLF